MAYNNFYPQYFPQPQPQPQVQMPMQMQTSFVNVRSEAEARNYPVRYGNSITFKDETQPYVYTKTMGFSQLDIPVFEKYRLVKEEAQEMSQASQGDNSIGYVTKSEFEALQSVVEGIKKKMYDLRKELGDVQSETNTDVATA